MFIFCNNITLNLLLCSRVGKMTVDGRTWHWRWHMSPGDSGARLVFFILVTSFWNFLGFGFWVEVGGAGRRVPHYPLLPAFLVAPSWMLSLMISFTRKSFRKKKIQLWRFVSCLCALFSSDTCPVHKKGDKDARKPRWKKENPPPVNKKTPVVAFFFMFFLLSFFLVEGKRGRKRTRRWLKHRHSVYIYQNFFAFNRAIAIKMCSCNYCSLRCLCVIHCRRGDSQTTQTTSRYFAK